jgi:hypothetical protein
VNSKRASIQPDLVFLLHNKNAAPATASKTDPEMIAENAFSGLELNANKEITETIKQ